MSHENEYHDDYVTMLELIWGEGYMAPGGPGNVAKLLRGIPTRGKLILDIGCGIGGPAFEMARTFDANVVGIDLEAPLIERATADAAKHGLSDRCTFRTVEVGPLDFADETFDVVLSSGALTQTADKAAMLAEIRRVLKPGGYLTCYDWLRHGDGEYSEDMLYWFELEGLTFAMATLDEYRELLGETGFDNIEVDDATDWYRVEARREYEQIRGPLYPKMVEAIGQELADRFVEDWRAMTVVIDNGEMRQGYVRGQRPA